MTGLLEHSVKKYIFGTYFVSAPSAGDTAINSIPANSDLIFSKQHTEW